MVYPRGHNHWCSQVFQRGGGGGAKRVSEATEWAESVAGVGVPPPTVEKLFFFCVCVCVCVWCVCNVMGEGRLWVYSGIQILYSPLFQFYIPINGDGAWPPCALLSYANDSGVAPGEKERKKEEGIFCACYNVVTIVVA